MIKVLNKASLADVRKAIRSRQTVRVGSSPLARGRGPVPDQAKQKGGKYGNRKVVYDGITFDSDGECDRYKFLKLLEKGGVITNLELQPEFILGIPGPDGKTEPARIRKRNNRRGSPLKMKGDFRYVIRISGQTVIEDFKGHDTRVSRLKRAWVELLYDVVIEVVKDANQPIGSKPEDQAQEEARTQKAIEQADRARLAKLR